MSDLKITSTCQPQPFQDGLQTLACGGTLQNTGDHLLYVVAIGVTPGETEADVVEYELAPGETAVLDAPPQGGVWVIGAETQAQRNRQSDWQTAGAVTVGALAGVGAAILLLAGIGAGRAAARRHRGY